MKKFIIVFVIGLLCIGGIANAQNVGSTNVFTNFTNTVSNFFVTIGKEIAGIFDLNANPDALTKFSDSLSLWQKMPGCATARKKAGEFADNYDNLFKVTVSPNVPIDSGAVTKPTKPSISPRPNVPIDSGAVTSSTMPSVLPRPGDSYYPTTTNPGYGNDQNLNSGQNPIPSPGVVPNSGGSSGGSFLKELWKFTQIDFAEATEGRDPCDELKRDKEAADKAAKDGNLTPKQRTDAQTAAKNIEQTIKDCCGFTGGGGGGTGGGVTDPIVIDPINPDNPNPPISPDNPNLPPDIVLPPGAQAAVCDFSSASYNEFYNCVPKVGPFQSGDIPCDMNMNLATQQVEPITKYFLGIFPYVSSSVQNISYNPVCMKRPDVVIPEQPNIPPVVVPVPNPDDGSGGGKDDEVVKPVVPPVEGMPLPTACRINYFSWSKYKKGSFLIFDSYPSYSLFTRPENNILDNPKLEYTATNCNSCKLSVTSVGLNGVSGFVDNEGNEGVFGNQTYTEKTSNNRYVFDKSAFNQEGIVLDLSGVSTGSYNFVLSCNDFFTGETQEKTVKLNVHPYIRWREVAPILNKDK